jgi:16S rRNA (adenine1518-N6/adenine1519-N6)-dimethyltransferase
VGAGPGRSAASTSDSGLFGATDIRALADRLGVAPSKGRGQNFVVDANTVRRIVTIARVVPGDRVLEVGPGLGSLTLALLDAGAEVIAVEIDPVLAGALGATARQRLPAQAGRLEVVGADAVRIVAADLPGAAPQRLVANLPYNVAVPVLLGLLERVSSLETGVVMVQAEVGRRLAAPPGSRTYGVPSVKAAWWADVRLAGAVSRSVFWPAPHVDSVLVAFTRRPAVGDEPLRRRAFALVDAAFAQRRKTLRSALSERYGSGAAAERALTAAAIDPGARGETLSVTDFARLAAHPPPASG